MAQKHARAYARTRERVSVARSLINPFSCRVRAIQMGRSREDDEELE